VTSAPQPKKKSGKIAIIIALVSLAACIPCIGIMAAIAIPSFTQYVRESKIVEAEQNLQMLYQGAAAYYDQERMAASPFQPYGEMRCTVDPAITPNQPAPERQLPSPIGPSFEALGFLGSEPLYYQYQIIGGPSRCNVGPNEAVYTLRATGDLDGDGAIAVFDLAVFTDPTGNLTCGMVDETDRYE
jgi:type II secretory pathway pseudopilin PulG